MRLLKKRGLATAQLPLVTWISCSNCGWFIEGVPATESHPEKSKKGIYRIADFFLRFWFRYVHPYQNALDLGMADGILTQRVRPTFEQFVSYVFEEAARTNVARLARSGQLSFLQSGLEVGGIRA